MNGHYRDLLVIDVETTGLLMQPNARIVEISLSLWTPDGHADRITSLINPQEPIPPSYTAIHGIDDAMVSGAPTFQEFWKEHRQIFEEKTIIAHNLSFDMGMLNRELLLQGDPPLGNPGIDTVPVLKKFLPNEENHKLRNLARSLGVIQENIHRAGDDVKALEEVLSLGIGLPLERLTGPLGIDLSLWGGLASHRYFRDVIWWAQQEDSPIRVYLAKMSEGSISERILEEFRIEKPGYSAKRLGEFREKGRYPLSWNLVYRLGR